MSGGKQHARQRQHGRGAAILELGQPFADHRLGELQIPVLDRPVGQPGFSAFRPARRTLPWPAGRGCRDRRASAPVRPVPEPPVLPATTPEPRRIAAPPGPGRVSSIDLELRTSLTGRLPLRRKPEARRPLPCPSKWQEEGRSVPTVAVLAPDLGRPHRHDFQPPSKRHRRGRRVQSGIMGRVNARRDRRPRGLARIGGSPAADSIRRTIRREPFPRRPARA